MKKIYFIIIVLLPFCSFSQDNLLNKFKQKVKGRAEQRTDEGMDKALDAAEGKIKEGADTTGRSKKEKKKEKTQTIQEDVKPAPETTQFQSYSHYDFIPGDDIVYAEDFSQDVVGEFPLKWSGNSHGETVTVKGSENKWMRMFQNGSFLSPYIKSLPENFTAEFDLILHYTDAELSYVFPEIDIMLLNSPKGDEKGREYFNSLSGLSDLKIAIAPANDNNSSVYLQSTKEGTEVFSNSAKTLEKLGYNYGKPVHFAVWIQKERFRLWMNGEKIYDIPQAVPENAAFNRMAITVASSNYEDEKVGYYISNIKFAQGTPDMRSKLLTEGKLATTGILFNANSDKIKPESFGVMQEIAKVLKENPSVKVKIAGHTDSDGDDAQNLDLSKRRAESVKQMLITQFGIDASLMETEGKGETQPVADNNSNEGKAKNRRVEFIKM